MNKIIALLLSIFFFCSCSEEEGLEEEWVNTIKLSTNDVEFNANGDSVIITTEGDSWIVDQIWLSSIKYRGHYTYTNEDFKPDSTAYTIIEEDFVVEKRDKNTLFILLGDNTTGFERTMGVRVSTIGQYNNAIMIRQRAK